MTKQYICLLETNIAKESSLELRLRKMDVTRNYILDEIKHSDLMSVSIRRHVSI